MGEFRHILCRNHTAVGKQSLNRYDSFLIKLLRLHLPFLIDLMNLFLRIPMSGSLSTPAALDRHQSHWMPTNRFELIRRLLSNLFSRCFSRLPVPFSECSVVLNCPASFRDVSGGTHHWHQWSTGRQQHGSIGPFLIRICRFQTDACAERLVF